MEKAEVSVIGAGLMGAAIVERLLKNGFRVCVYNRTMCKLNDLLRSGAETIAVIDEGFIRRGGVWVLCLRDEASIVDVFSVIKREKFKGGKLKGKMNGVVVNTSTIGVKASERLERLFTGLGVQYVEMPVSGGVEGAKAGQLIGYIGKMPKSLRPQFGDIVKVLLRDFCCMQSNVRAQAMKVINNYCESMHLLVAAEALVLAESFGIEKDMIGASLSLGRGRSVYLELLLKRYMSQSRNISVPMDIRIKDLELAGDLFSELDVPSLFYSHAHDLYTKVQTSDPKSMDQMEVYDHISNLARREV